MMRTAVVLLLTLTLFIPAYSQSAEKAPELEDIRFHDANEDGMNDLFRDADGNGVNDVSGKAYRHRFTYEDADDDGKNDLFQDSDGDGVNDLLVNKEGRKITDTHYYVIDCDEDGVNDVTGQPYTPAMSGQNFIDEDGDGINDNNTAKSARRIKGRGKQMDTFTDEDGDGINDGRGFGGQGRNAAAGKGQGRGYMKRKGRK